MRVLIFVFLLIFVPSQSEGQDSSLFVIVSCSQGVMLDGEAVSPGQMVYRESSKLSVSKGGYAGVLTIDGYSFLFNTKISIDVSAVSKFIFKKKYDSRLGGTVNLESPVRLIDDTHFHSPYVIGDSILLGWWPLKEKTMQIKFESMSDELLKLDSTTKNWIVVSTTELFKKDSLVIFSVYEKDRLGRNQFQNLIKRPLGNRLKALAFDMNRLKSVSDKVFLQIILFELYDLFYDHLFQLYQLEYTSNQSQNRIFSSYITQQKKKYQFHLFDFHK
jgi:hypothetical protein